MKHTMIFLALALSAGGANAAALNIFDIEGSWQNPDPTLGITIANDSGQATDTVRWGTSGQSGYDFTTSGDFTTSTGTNFLLGTFVHINNPIRPPTLDSIDYSLGFGTNGDPSSLSALLSFTHNETVNLEPCEVPGSSVCDDLVTLSVGAVNQPIDVLGQGYFFNLLGFSPDGLNSTLSTVFQSPENGSNSIGLWASITAEPVSVPEPAALALLGLGLAGLGAARRRRTQA